MEPNKLQNIEAENINQSKHSTWNGDKMMSIAAIFISVLSMFAVTYQSYLAREENEMMRIQQSASVLPYLDQSYSDIDGKITFEFENKGVGPAFIKKVQFTAITPENKDSLVFNSLHQLMSFMEQKSSIIDNIDSILSSFQADMLMSQNEVITYINFPFNNDKERELIWQEYYKFKVSFNVVYEDVYGTAWRLSSNSNAPIKLKKSKIK